jgi:SLT domain-containing protein
MATGGIVTSPTFALIGEAGPEAVIPLSKMGGMGGGITVNVNGGDPQAVVDALRRYQRQNGFVPITVGV